MTRYFNTEGSCNPKEHYMVRLDGRLERIKRILVGRKKYFVINRGRQYGKTTTLRALEEYLKDDYIVLSLDFQEVSTESFANGVIFSQAFSKNCPRHLALQGQQIKKKCKNCCLILKRIILMADWMSCLSA